MLRSIVFHPIQTTLALFWLWRMVRLWRRLKREQKLPHYLWRGLKG